jgi:hypothetical protein
MPPVVQMERKWALEYGNLFFCVLKERASVDGNCNIFFYCFLEANGLWDILVIFFYFVGKAMGSLLWAAAENASKSSEEGNCIVFGVQRNVPSTCQYSIKVKGQAGQIELALKLYGFIGLIF